MEVGQLGGRAVWTGVDVSLAGTLHSMAWAELSWARKPRLPKVPRESSLLCSQDLESQVQKMQTWGSFVPCLS